MGIFLALFLTVAFNHFSWFSFTTLPSTIPAAADLPPTTQEAQQSPNDIRQMLQQQASTLKPLVLDKVMRALKCTTEHRVDHNNILTVIDYSLPSNEKRLWVFDLKENKLLFHTYVSHGIKSGTLFTNYFSNKQNSKASSIGVYRTDQAYYGREGLSLRLTGLEVSFNDNAANRSIVMHGGWYMSEDFIKKYGRPGRSWGCPAVPKALFQPIINTIKGNSLFVVYYPNENWLVKSRFLNCEGVPLKVNLARVQNEIKPALGENEAREDVLFADLNKLEAILTIPAETYEHIFQTKPPLGRMLRRQIDHAEYIALSTLEFNNLAKNKIDNQELLNALHLVTPVLKIIRGYTETQMKIVPFGKVKELKVVDNKHYSISFESKSAVGLRPSSHFIRWLGL